MLSHARHAEWHRTAVGSKADPDACVVKRLEVLQVHRKRRASKVGQLPGGVFLLPGRIAYLLKKRHRQARNSEWRFGPGDWSAHAVLASSSCSVAMCQMFPDFSFSIKAGGTG